MPVSSKYEIYIVLNKRRDRHIHIHTFTFFIILFHSYLKQLNSKTRKKNQVNESQDGKNVYYKVTYCIECLVVLSI